MNGSVKVKILAAVIIAVLAVSAVSIISMVPSNDTSVEETIQPEILSIDERSGQSKSLQMLLETLNICNMYIGDADSTEYTYVYGTGCDNVILDVNEYMNGGMSGSILLNSGAIVDFTTCKELKMNGFDICINGSGIKFKTDDNQQFKISFENGAAMRIGANIALGVSTSITSTPFEINYSSGNSKLFTDDGELGKSLIVNSSFSINLDDSISDGTFTFKQKVTDGEKASYDYRVMDTTYSLTNRVGEELSVEVKCNFTEYYRSLSETENDTSEEPFSFADWVEYYLMEDHVMPDGSLSVHMNGLTMTIDYEYGQMNKSSGSGTDTATIRKGVFTVTDVKDLEFDMVSSDSQKFQEISVSTDDLTYNNNYTDKKMDVSNGKQIGSESKGNENVVVENFEFITLDSTANVDRTEIDLSADLVTIDIRYDYDTYFRIMNYEIDSLDVEITMNKSNVRDLYAFIIQVLSDEDRIDILLNTDYALVLCDAIVNMTCESFSLDSTYEERAKDSSNTMKYVPHDTWSSMTFNGLVFECNYDTSEESSIEFDEVTAEDVEKFRTMEPVSNGYVPTLKTSATNTNISGLDIESKFTLTDMNTIFSYVIKAAVGEDVSDTEIRGAKTALHVDTVEVIESYTVGHAEVVKTNSKWDNGYNDDGLFPDLSDERETKITLSDFTLDDDISGTQKEVGTVNLDSLKISSSEDSEGDGKKSMRMYSEICDIYCTIDSSKPKMIVLAFSLARDLSNGVSAEGLKDFVDEYVLDRTDLEMGLFINKVSLDYTNETYSGNTKVGSDLMTIRIGEDNYSGEGRAISVTMDLNAGNDSSKVGYHDSCAEIEMSDNSRIEYTLSSSGNNGTGSESYYITGLNGRMDIDSIIGSDVTLESFEMTSTAGTNKNNYVTKEMSLSNTHITADIEYDRAYELREYFFSNYSGHEDSCSVLEAICDDRRSFLSSEYEYGTLISGISLQLTSDRDVYKVISIAKADGQTNPETTQGSNEYVIEGCEIELDYLNDNYVQLDFEHVDSSSFYYHAYDFGTADQRTEYKTYDADTYNVHIWAETELDGLNDFVRYAERFLTGSDDSDEGDIDEFTDMSLEMSFDGTDEEPEYKSVQTVYNKYKQLSKLKNGSAISSSEIVSVRNVQLDFDSISFTIIAGTSGIEQVSMACDGLQMDNTYRSYASDGRELDIVLDIDYFELFIGTNSESMYKLAMAAYAYSTGSEESDDNVTSALVSFITDSTNTKFILRLTGGEFYIKDKIGVVGSEYKISVPKSKLEQYAVVAEGSLKIKQADDFSITMDGTYLTIEMAEDSKVIYSDSYGGNAYLEYFEFTNMDAAFNVKASINPSEFLNYVGNEKKIIAFVKESIQVKGVMTADSGKYTSIRMDSDDSTYYNIRIGSKDGILIRVDSNVSELMSSGKLPNSIIMEGGESYIQSDYSDPSVGTVTQIFKFQQFKVYMESGKPIVESESIDASVIINDVTYGMETDGKIYFNSEFPSLKGYSMMKNGVLYSDRGYGIAPTIRIDTFTVSGDSELYAGKTFVKGTMLALTETSSGSNVFAGWRINDVLVPKDRNGGTVYYAPMDDEVTITYVFGYILNYRSNDNNDSDILLRSVVMDLNESIDLSYVPERTGYVFQKWNTTFREMPAYNLTIYAVWAPNTYKLTIDYGNGSDVQTTDVQYGGDVSKPTEPTREGYTFAGWLGYKENMRMPAYDLTIKALWSRNITTDMIGGDVSEKTIDVGADVAVMDKDVIDSLTEESSAYVSMTFSGASISMKAESLKTLSEDEISGKISGMKMSVTKSETISESILKKMTSDDKKLLDNVKYAISIDVTTNGCTSGLGRVTVTVPVDNSYLGSTFEVLYIASDGTVSIIHAECIEVNGQTCIVFETDHFSYFALSQTSEAAAEDDGGSSSSSTIMYIAIGAACVLMIIFIVLMILKRRYII